MSDYEQTGMDMRDGLERKIGELATRVVCEARDAIQEYNEACTWRDPPGEVRNRHEAYGHAAEQLHHIQYAVKQIGKDTQDLLGTLSDPDKPALDAVCSICNSTWMAAVRIITAAAEMHKIREELYSAESGIEPKPTPMEEWAAKTQVTCYEKADADTEAEALADEGEALREADSE